MSDIEIEACDPRDRADEIVDLFEREGLPEFRQVFERVYRPRAKRGLRSWVGIKDERVVMHVSMSPQPFGRSDAEATVGIMGDLMVDADVRNFWRPIRLLKAVRNDLKLAAEVQALITTTTEEAQPVFRAGGFEVMGDLRRFVLPIAAPFRILSRAVNAVLPSGAVVRPLGSGDCNRGPVFSSAHSGDNWRPRPCDDFYRTRIPRGGFADGTWIGVEGSGDESETAWILLSRHPEWREYSVADAFWLHDGRNLARALLDAASWARRQDAKCLSVVTLDDTQASRRLRRIGFIGRGSPGPLLVQRLTEEPIPPPSEWFVTGLITSAW